MKWNTPNILTLIRIISIPIFVLVFYLPMNWSHPLSAIIFALACFTDWLDGYLARNWQQITPFGAFLDPVADKLIVAVALVLIVGERSVPYLAIPAAIIVGREIVVSALREWMSELGKRTSVAVSKIGKVKTGLQMAALIMLLAYIPGSSKILLVLGALSLYVAAVLTLWSMVIYLQTAWPDLTFSAEKE